MNSRVMGLGGIYSLMHQLVVGFRAVLVRKTIELGDVLAAVAEEVDETLRQQARQDGCPCSRDGNDRAGNALLDRLALLHHARHEMLAVARQAGPLPALVIYKTAVT